MKHTQNQFAIVVYTLLISASICQAAVTFDSFTGAQVNYSTPTLGGPLTWSHTVGTGDDRALLVAISFEDGNESVTVVPAAVSFGSQALVQLGSVRMASGTVGPGGFDNQVSLWYLANPTSTTESISVGGLTLDNPNNNVKGFAGSFFGVGGYAGLTTASGSAGTTSLSFTGLDAGSAVFASVNNSGGTITFNSTDLTLPLGVFQGGGSSSQGGYSLNLSGSVTASVTGPTGGRTPMIGVALVPVPEPSSLLLGTLGLAGLLRRRRSL